MKQIGRHRKQSSGYSGEGESHKGKKNRGLRDANYCVPSKLDIRIYLTTQGT